MEQHPIPQNISSYQFRLVGDMTLKQFFELAGGIGVGLLFYAAPIIGIIKWPLIILSVILGIGLAFVPLNERPLEQWIFAFFRAIYSPTIFNWSKTKKPYKFFADETSVSNIPENLSNAQDVALKNYMNNTKQFSGPLAKLEDAEKGFLATIMGMFAGFKNPTPQESVPTSTTPTPQTGPKKLEVPITQSVKITPAQPTHLVVEEKVRPVVQTANIQTQQVNPTIAGDEIVSTKEAIFSIDAAPPSPPTNSNVVVGQVVDENRKIIESAIIEIRDEYGRPIRALRSNKLGHFMAVTPLENGKYSIVSEKDDYQFMPVNFEAKDEIIPPILVEGRRLQLVQTTEIINPMVGTVLQN